MPASLSAARRSTALPSSNSAFSFSRLSDSPPGVRNRQEIRGTYLTARKWNQSRLLQDSFDLFFLVPFNEWEEEVGRPPYPTLPKVELFETPIPNLKVRLKLPV
ncbi:hypothetical protein VNO78_35172 [Psophocarpus tetragonolobus]|uniref:Uncharacterized protein n=1 Tax=Psophocarpus tetragonolobus TaxID=3891 RepID=A0AAN9RLC5_PSOTE